MDGWAVAVDQWPIFTKEVNPNLAKPPLKFDGGLAKLRITSIVK